MVRKGRGWHDEPKRHADAARGIKTVDPRLAFEKEGIPRLGLRMISAADQRHLEKEVVQLFRIWNYGGEDFSLLHTQLDWMTPRELIWALNMSPTVVGYNAFSATEMAIALSSTRGIKEVKFGREYSPVLYIRTEPGMYESVLRNFRKHIHRDNWPNEYDEQEKFGGRVIRAWWD